MIFKTYSFESVILHFYPIPPTLAFADQGKGGVKEVQITFIEGKGAKEECKNWHEGLVENL